MDDMTNKENLKLYADELLNCIDHIKTENYKIDYYNRTYNKSVTIDEKQNSFRTNRTNAPKKLVVKADNNVLFRNEGKIDVCIVVELEMKNDKIKHEVKLNNVKK